MLEVLLGVGGFSHGQLKMRHLGLNPCGIFDLARRRGLQRHVHQFQRAVHISEDLAQIRGPGDSGEVSGTQVEHELGRFFCFVVVPQFSVGVSQEAVNHDIVRHSLAELESCFTSCRELVFPQQQPNLDSFSIEVVGRNLE